MPLFFAYQTVADAGFREQVTGFLGVHFDLLSESCHIDMEVVGLGAVFWTLHLLEEHPVGENFVGVGDERLQEIILHWRQTDLAPANTNLASL
jgi:hypothetical protein